VNRVLGQLTVIQQGQHSINWPQAFGTVDIASKNVSIHYGKRMRSDHPNRRDGTSNINKRKSSRLKRLRNRKNPSIQKTVYRWSSTASLRNVEASFRTRGVGNLHRVFKGQSVTLIAMGRSVAGELHRETEMNVWACTWKSIMQRRWWQNWKRKNWARY